MGVWKRRSVQKPAAQAAGRLRIRQHPWANTALDLHGKVTGSDASSLLSPSTSLGRMIKHKKTIWLRKNIKLCMKNEIMASEWRSLQICWPGNHFKVNCSKSSLDLLLEKYLFSVYVTQPLCLFTLHNSIWKGREVTSPSKHISSGKEEPLCTFGNNCHFILDSYICT